MLLTREQEKGEKTRELKDKKGQHKKKRAELWGQFDIGKRKGGRTAEGGYNLESDEIKATLKKGGGRELNVPAGGHRAKATQLKNGTDLYKRVEGEKLEGGQNYGGGGRGSLAGSQLKAKGGKCQRRLEKGEGRVVKEIHREKKKKNNARKGPKKKGRKLRGEQVMEKPVYQIGDVETGRGGVEWGVPWAKGGWIKVITDIMVAPCSSGKKRGGGRGTFQKVCCWK